MTNHYAPMTRIETKACAGNGSICHHCGRHDPKVVRGFVYDYVCPCGACWSARHYVLTQAEYAELMRAS